MNKLHIGFDPQGLRFTIDGREPSGRSLYFLKSLPQHGDPEWDRVCGPWEMYGPSGQKSHAHPRFTACGRWIQMVGGDPESGTNHTFLINVRDLPSSAGLPDFSN